MRVLLIMCSINVFNARCCHINELTTMSTPRHVHGADNLSACAPHPHHINSKFWCDSRSHKVSTIFFGHYALQTILRSTAAAASTKNVQRLLVTRGSAYSCWAGTVLSQLRILIMAPKSYPGRNGWARLSPSSTGVLHIDWITWNDSAQGKWALC